MSGNAKAPFSLLRPLHRALGWLLRGLVRAHVLPDDFEAPEGPVCYVIESNALSNVLILQQVCQDLGLPSPTDTLMGSTPIQSRALLSLQRLHGVLIRRRDMRAHLRYLTNMVRAVEKDPELDIQLIPVSIFLGRRPDKDSGVFRLLFSENWPVAGRIRRLITLIIHGRSTLVQFSRPLSLRAMLDEEIGRPRTVRKTSRVLRVHFRRARTAAIGPDLSHRRTLVGKIIRSRPVREAIKAQAKKRKLPIAKVRRQARKYANEIAADSSYPVIQLLSRALGWFWNRIYDGIKINHLQQFLDVTQGTEIVYVPCHRSHIDYLLVSYLVYHKGLTVPHIAAGVNLNLPVVGPILRRGGAFFLRRSFRSDALYSSVFNEYVDSIIARGVSMEYFIEGGRSRSGRLLQPRTGMLAMTLRSYLRHPHRPVVFVPIYVGYERLVEGGAYLHELSGGRKKQETLGGLVRSVDILRQKYGRVHVSFGEPIFLHEYLDAQHPGWREEAPDDDSRPKWLSSVTESLARQVQINVNRAADVNPINLVALALLSTPKNSMAESDLEDQIELLRGLMLAVPYSEQLTVTDMAPDEMIELAESMGFITRRGHALGDVMSCSETSAWLLSYFRNNVVHVITAMSWIACVFENNVSFRREDLHRIGRVVYPFLRTELFLHWDGDQFKAVCDQCIEVLEERGLLVNNGDEDVLNRAHGESRQAMQLKQLAEPIFSSLERYYITVALLVKNGPGTLSAGQLENLCHLTAQRLSMIYTFDTPEFFDKALFKQFIRTLRDFDVVETDEEGKLTFDRSLNYVIQDAKVVLSKEVRHTIWQVTPEHSDPEQPESKEKVA